MQIRSKAPEPRAKSSAVGLAVSRHSLHQCSGLRYSTSPATSAIHPRTRSTPSMAVHTRSALRKCPDHVAGRRVVAGVLAAVEVRDAPARAHDQHAAELPGIALGPALTEARPHRAQPRAPG